MKKKKLQFNRISGLLLTSVIMGTVVMPTVPALAAVASQANSIKPGESVSAGEAAYPSSDYSAFSSWHQYGAASLAPTNRFSSVLVDNQPNRVGTELFADVMDMTRPASFSGTFTTSLTSDNPGDKANSMDSGDALGFILMPAGISDETLRDVNQTATGGSLGLAGLADSSFIGRDFHSNPGTDGEAVKPSTPKGGASNLSIRTTDSRGTIKTTGYANADAPDAGLQEQTSPSQSTAHLTNLMTVTWIPELRSLSVDNQTLSGSLTYTVSSPTAPSYQLSSRITVKTQMKLATVASTGSNYSMMSFISEGNHFSVQKPSTRVRIEYIDQETGQSIAPSTSLVAPIGTAIAINAPGQAGADGRTIFDVENVMGYAFVSAPGRININENVKTYQVFYRKLKTKSPTVPVQDNNNSQSNQESQGNQASEQSKKPTSPIHKEQLIPSRDVQVNHLRTVQNEKTESQSPIVSAVQEVSPEEMAPAEIKPDNKVAGAKPSSQQESQAKVDSKKEKITGKQASAESFKKASSPAKGSFRAIGVMSAVAGVAVSAGILVLLKKLLALAKFLR
ncbi:hypothetical protein [Lactococcus termiticola]|uniref:Cell surface protein n=1 Tax=Lactococcus termiticola TaxID=2169526 RepID=A0A2R5HF65_9LACT|nr:hypothetical protein [Lactococcus termiticola]GBG96684.1 hypothetical protein NtB2_00808 [Lactococcus termiticola]